MVSEEVTKKDVTSIPEEAQSIIIPDKFCGDDCGNFNKPGCPQFTLKIPRDTPMPLRCYGQIPPLPTQEEDL
jgi:hypothetical protein